MLLIFTGNGKGKTTAALGTALRASGWDRRVAIIQFIKGNKEIGEWKALKKISNFQFPISNDGVASPHIEIFQFFDDNKYSITDRSILANPEYKKSCEQAWVFAKKLLEENNHHLVVMDEINNALKYKLLDEKEVLNFINKYRENPDTDIVMTGRDASKELIDLADLVTETKEVKHPFKKGINAKRGLDF